MIEINNKNIYFFSDLHLGFPDEFESRKREKKLVNLLEEIETKVLEIWFLGDIFDFWWEYKKVIPRGFTRFLGKIADYTDAGIPVHFFAGNHDIWMKNYLSEEIGVQIHSKPVKVKLGGKMFYMAHGDGLGPGDYKYKLLKKIFTNKFLQWSFTRIHPNFAFFLAHKWSHHSRAKGSITANIVKEKEFLILHAENVLMKEYFDFFVFGHRHVPMHFELSQKAQFINTGEWIYKYTFAVFNGENINLMTYKNNIQESYEN